MFPRFFKFLIPGIAGVIAIKCSDYFELHTIPKILAVLLATMLATIFSVLADEVLLNAKKNNLFIRKIFDKRARFEGDWFIETEPGSRMPYGEISIVYNTETDGYVYSGAAYDVSGKLASEWSCDSLQFDVPNARVRFVAQTIIKGDGGAEHVSYGWISFRKVHNRRRLRFARGNGFFQLIGKPDIKGEFGVERLDPRFLKKVLGVPCISTRDEMAKVVTAYHQKKLERETANSSEANSAQPQLPTPATLESP